MDIKLEITSSKCSPIVNSDAVLVERNNKIIIDGSVTAPNPCYGLKHVSEVKNNELVINLQLTKPAGICIQCIAKLSFKLIIIGISDEIKTITVLYQNKEILRYSL